MTLLLLCLLFMAHVAVSRWPALVQPATLGQSHSPAAEPRTKGVRMDCIEQRTTCTERPAIERRPLTGDRGMPHWPFPPLTPMQQDRIKAQRKALGWDQP